jgi:hypothetical protein
MADIFISYARKDENKVRMLAEALEAHGLSVWWDLKIRTGERFDDRIEQMIEEAKCVIVVWSIHSKRSKYVKDEAAFADKLCKLVPVAIEKVEPPLRFHRIQTQQLSDWDGSDYFPPFQKLVNDIAAYTKAEKGKVEDSPLDFIGRELERLKTERDQKMIIPSERLTFENKLKRLETKRDRIIKEARKTIEDSNRLIEKIFR